MRKYTCPKIAPSHGEMWPQPSSWFLGPITRVHTRNGIWIGSAVFVGHTHRESHTHTHTHTHTQTTLEQQAHLVVWCGLKIARTESVTLPAGHSFGADLTLTCSEVYPRAGVDRSHPTELNLSESCEMSFRRWKTRRRSSSGPRFSFSSARNRDDDIRLDDQFGGGGDGDAVLNRSVAARRVRRSASRPF